MALRAGFAEVDITPPIGTEKAGWIIRIESDSVLDPLFARVAVFENEGENVAFVQLDTLSVRWTMVNEIHKRLAARYGFPGERVMVAATHNHAGPAIGNIGDACRDDAYIETLTQKVVGAFGQALQQLQDAELGVGRCFEFRVSHNRRVVMRDGTARTHGTFDDPNALCLEGPIDPEVAVLACRSTGGEPLGVLVNFTCHPTHHGGEKTLSAGYPGVFANEMKARGWPVPIFLNGASGNVHTSDPTRGGAGMSMEEAGATLAADALRLIERLQYRRDVKLGCRSRTIQLPYRRASPEEIAGQVPGAQRFVDPAAYDRHMQRLLERIRQRQSQPAEVQVVFLDEYAFAAIPAEYFVQHGLRIKEQSHPRHALLVGHANGMVGYVPHKDAFLRGGYETTFGFGSRLAPEAGDLLADAAIDLIRSGPG